MQRKPLGKLSAALLALTGLLLVPALAFAQEEGVALTTSDIGAFVLSQENANILWTTLTAVLVMFMQAGFACVEAGFTRAKNAGNIMMKNVIDYAVGTPAFFLVGFAIMFGVNGLGGLVGTTGFALTGAEGFDLIPGDAANPGSWSSNWTITFWFFQSVFAATAATIVSGAIAERTKFPAYILLSVVTTALIYPVFGHWAWGGLANHPGWLENLTILGATGFYDFAGSSVVHSVGGWVGLAGAIVMGPRIGKYAKDGTAKAFPGHNIPLAALGVFILWFGWFGFNPGSTTTADSTIGVIAVVTTLSGAMGTLGAMFTAWMLFGKPDVSMTLNGALAGLVAITAGCAAVSPIGALAIGFSAGVLVVLAVIFIDKSLKVDDPVGAVSVHGVCGAFGTLMVGLFHTETGLFYGGGMGQLCVQAVGVGTAFVWAFGMGFIAFKVVDMIIGVRASREEELKGLDITEHGSEAYNGFQIFTVE